MSDSAKRNNVLGQSSKDDFSPQLLQSIAIATEELNKLSNKEAKELLTMLCSIRNLRVVSMDRPIGLSSAPAVRSRVTRGSYPERTIVPKRAAWKSHPEWVSAIAEHTKTVETLKTAREEEKPTIVGILRSIEQSMKPLKQKLMGFRADA
jgi:hypothetical protein